MILGLRLAWGLHSGVDGYTAARWRYGRDGLLIHGIGVERLGIGEIEREKGGRDINSSG